MNRKKLMTSGIALALSAALLLGGTFAWQSISQTAENEAGSRVNPGGRLHDDFDGNNTEQLQGEDWKPLYNKNIYVENFGEEPIFARLRLEEYFALVINKGLKDAEGNSKATVEEKLGTRTLNNDGTYTYEPEIYQFSKAGRTSENVYRAGYDSDTGEYHWSWTVGSPYERFTMEEYGIVDQITNPNYYMPTFNKNKDSLAADVNGWLANGIGTFSKGSSADLETVVAARSGSQYEGYETWDEGDSIERWAIYDIDRTDNDELSGLTAAQLRDITQNGDSATAWMANSTVYAKAVELVQETHDAELIADTKGLISMTEWLALLKEDGVLDENGKLTAAGVELVSDYWVYDDDSENGGGWVYWSSPILPETTTGLLLDGIQKNGVMDDSYYYAINVVAQFVTANDIGKDLNDDTAEADGTGFYDANEGAVPTENAEKLLKLITNEDTSSGEDVYAVFYENESPKVDEDGNEIEDDKGNKIEEPDGTYTAYYVTAASTNEARDMVLALNEGEPHHFSGVGKASQVNHESDLVKNTIEVHVGGQYKLGGGEKYDFAKFDMHKVAPTDMSGWFENFGSGDGEDPYGTYFYFSGLNTSNVTNMARLFQGAYIKNSVENEDDANNNYSGLNFNHFEGWDTSNVVNLSDCFKDAGVEALDLSTWNTGNVKNMSGMFSGCVYLTKLTLGNEWSTDNVTDMNYMFTNCYNLTIDCTSWNVSSVDDSNWAAWRKVRDLSADVMNSIKDKLVNTDKISSITPPSTGPSSL